MRGMSDMPAELASQLQSFLVVCEGVGNSS